MMRVAFGGGSLMTPLTGIGQYALQIGRGLQQHPDVELACFHGGSFHSAVGPVAPRLRGRLRTAIRKHIPHAYALRRMVEQVRFDGGQRARPRFDVYHEPNYLALRFDGPTVITVHDVSWIRFPEMHPRERVEAMERFFPPALARASILITPSRFVKQEVLDVFGGAPERIVAVDHGVDPVFRPMDPSQTRPALDRFNLRHGEYFLSVGTIEPRKNLQATVAAYSRLPAELRRRYPLVLAGTRGWQTSPIEKLLHPLVASGEARVLGYLERSELAQVTAGALAMVYPSFYEGFGLPPLEAMGCGVPPIISATGALLEVVGDCGPALEPNDTEGLSAAMARMAQDPALRARLAARSLQRAAGFTWHRAVEETLAAYRRAVTSSR